MAPTFAYRDERIQQVSAAIAARDDEIARLEKQIAVAPMLPEQVQLLHIQNRHNAARAAFADELRKLGGNRKELSDEAVETLARGMLRRWSRDVADAVGKDAAYLGSGGRPLTETESQLIGSVRPTNEQSPADAMVAAGVDRAIAQPLVAVALGRWLQQSPETSDWQPREVGVLLPLRLEVVFEGGDDDWTMLLRIIPDEASILRDSAKITIAEAEYLALFWDASKVAYFALGTRSFKWLIDPRGVVAWETFANRVTPQRAAYLVGAFPAYIENGRFVASVPPDRIGDPEPQRIGGLPPELQVCIVDRDKGRVTVGHLQPALKPDEFRVPRSDKDFDENWLLSWPRARAVGMGDAFALPSGVTPQTIETLYVCGIGEDTPEKHFRAHADAGEMALMRLGAPTNTVQGIPAADLDKDAESWRIIAKLRLTGETGAAVPGVWEALCGNAGGLPYLGGDSGDLDDSRLMVAALWPALWGHFHRDFWNGVDDFHELWKWSLQSLHPEGPLLPLRIGAQPYGLLPATSLRRWQPAGDNFDRVETRLVERLLQLIPIWQAAAESRGTVAQGGTDDLLRCLGRSGVSSNYIYRAFSNVDWLRSVYGAIPGNKFEEAANELWSATAALMQQPSVPHDFLATGYAAPLELPLIGSTRLLPDGMKLWEMAEQIYRIDVARFADVFFGQGREYVGVMRKIVPHSLLVRLAMHSMFLVKAWLVESARGTDRPVVNPATWNDPDDYADTAIEYDQAGFWNSYTNGLGRPEVLELVRDHEGSITKLFEILDSYVAQGPDPLDSQADPVMRLSLPAELEAQLERALRATLDSAGHRIDPFATGIAWRRLRQQIDSGNSRHRLGVYGWLDGPFEGRPGPTPSGRLHAPSRAQAIVGIVLRDKQLSSEGERMPDEAKIWTMNMTSEPVRLAVAIAEDVRAGFHFFEVVGRRVEGIVGGKDEIEALRREAPLRPGRPDTRDTCNGVRALERLLGSGIAGVLSRDAAVADEQRRALRTLDAALDTYGDLLVAEGVHQVVSGHANIAADAMDAAAGFARPPEFEFIRTPPSGYRLSSSVLAVLPYRDVRDDENALPIELADASLSAFLDEWFADGDRWVWTTKANEGSQRTTSLAQMGLRPIETLLLSEDTMIEIVRSLQHQATGAVTSPPVHRLMRHLAGLLGGPPSLADVARSEDVGSGDDIERQRIGRELAARLATARQALKTFIDAAEGARPDEHALRDWLRRALRWGALPALESQPRRRLFDLLWGDAEATEEELSNLVTNAQGALRKRLQSETAADASPATLAQAISDLILPGSRLAITVMWETDRLRSLTGLRADVPDETLEGDWLTVVAAVRPILTRLEAMQLETGLLDPPLSKLPTWTNTDDHWQAADVVGKNVAQRDGGEDTSRLTFRKFVAAFGPEASWQADKVAVSLIDAFSEAVPMAQRSSYAAFGFNAPAARPPQAILLAVPPRAEDRLEENMLIDILEETRQLLRTRAVAPEDLSGLPIVPSTWFDGASAMRIRLDAGSQYWR